MTNGIAVGGCALEELRWADFRESRIAYLAKHREHAGVCSP